MPRVPPVQPSARRLRRAGDQCRHVHASCPRAQGSMASWARQESTICSPGFPAPKTIAQTPCRPQGPHREGLHLRRLTWFTVAIPPPSSSSSAGLIVTRVHTSASMPCSSSMRSGSRLGQEGGEWAEAAQARARRTIPRRRPGRHTLRASVPSLQRSTRLGDAGHAVVEQLALDGRQRLNGLDGGGGGGWVAGLGWA